MKKLFLTILVAVAATAGVFANVNEVNSAAVAHFTTNFNKASNIKWENDKQFDKVNFTNDYNVAMSAFYDAGGELIGTSQNVDFDKLPKKAINVITTKYTYPEYQLKESIAFTDPEGETTYFLSFSKKDETVILNISGTGSVDIFAVNRK